jgi:hypothetical protein
MAKFEINDFEGGFKTEITAQGIVEAMHDYLPWPSVDVSVKWSPSSGVYEVVDNQTYFNYEVKLV